MQKHKEIHFGVHILGFGSATLPLPVASLAACLTLANLATQEPFLDSVAREEAEQEDLTYIDRDLLPPPCAVL